MARPALTPQVLLAAAAGLGALFVAARVAPSRATSAELVLPAARTGSASAVPGPSASAAPRPEAAGPLDLAERDKAIPAEGGNAFARLSWLPPPPPPPPPAPPVIAAPVAPPPPSAPPMPFTFVGMVEKGAARPQAFLAKGEALFVVAAGDTLENQTYRIDALSPTAVVLTYLPLGKQQTISITGGSK